MVRALIVGLTVGLLLVGAESRIRDKSQDQQSPPSTKVVLEVTATEHDIGVQQQYLYLRLFSNGNADAQVLTRKAAFEHGTIENKRTTLADTDLREVLALVDDPGILSLDARYPQRIGDMLDAFTAWRVSLHHSNREQQVEIIAFAPDTAKRKNRPYPRALLRLGCIIEKVRDEAVGLPVQFGRECEKILSKRKKDAMRP